MNIKQKRQLKKKLKELELRLVHWLQVHVLGHEGQETCQVVTRLNINMGAVAHRLLASHGGYHGG